MTLKCSQKPVLEVRMREDEIFKARCNNCFQTKIARGLVGNDCFIG